jgi:hypothetical protein
MISSQRGREIILQKIDGLTSGINSRLVIEKRLMNGADILALVESLKETLIEGMQEAVDQTVRHQGTKAWYGQEDHKKLRNSFEVTVK